MGLIYLYDIGRATDHITHYYAITSALLLLFPLFTPDIFLSTASRTLLTIYLNLMCDMWQWRTGGGGIQTIPEIPKALQNRAKLNPIVKT